MMAAEPGDEDQEIKTMTTARLFTSGLLAALLAAALIAAGCGTTTNGGNGETPGDTPPANGGDTGNADGGNEQDVGWGEVESLWIEKREDPRYPASRFLLGFGSSPYSGDGSADTADGAARAEIRAFFETKIISEVQRVQETIIAAASDAPAGIREMSFGRSDVTAIVRGEVEGTEIKDRKISPDRRVIWSLAVLDRAKAADALKRKIDALKREIANDIARGDAATESQRWISAVQAYSPIMQKYQRLVTLVNSYNLIKPAGYPTIEPDIDLEAITGKLIFAAQQLTFAMNFEVSYTFENGRKSTQPSASIESAVQQYYADQGVPITIVRSTDAFRRMSLDQIKRLTAKQAGEALGQPVNYILTGSFTTQHIGNQDYNGRTLHRYRGRYSVEAIQLETNVTWPVADPQGTAQGRNANHETACAQAITQAARLMAQALTQRFEGS
jgi:hypothetical protein